MQGKNITVNRSAAKVERALRLGDHRVDGIVRQMLVRALGQFLVR
jgi:hypothetical protein